MSSTPIPPTHSAETVWQLIQQLDEGERRRLRARLSPRDAEGVLETIQRLTKVEQGRVGMLLACEGLLPGWSVLKARDLSPVGEMGLSGKQQRLFDVVKSGYIGSETKRRKVKDVIRDLWPDDAKKADRSNESALKNRLRTRLRVLKHATNRNLSLVGCKWQLTSPKAHVLALVRTDGEIPVS
jgi:hypothetical protein